MEEKGEEEAQKERAGEIEQACVVILAARVSQIVAIDQVTPAEADLDPGAIAVIATVPGAAVGVDALVETVMMTALALAAMIAETGMMIGHMELCRAVAFTAPCLP